MTRSERGMVVPVPALERPWTSLPREQQLPPPAFGPHQAEPCIVRSLASRAGRHS